MISNYDRLIKTHRAKHNRAERLHMARLRELHRLLDDSTRRPRWSRYSKLTERYNRAMRASLLVALHIAADGAHLSKGDRRVSCYRKGYQIARKAA